MSESFVRVPDAVARLLRRPVQPPVPTHDIIVTAARPRPPRRRRAPFADGPHHRVPWPWLLVAPLVLLLPPVAASEEDAMLVSAASPTASAVGGEVERPSGVRQAIERFVAWEAWMRETPAASIGRQEVAEGIRLLADVVQQGADRPLGSASWETLASMRWHGTQLTAQPSADALGEYADAGHVHSAFVHAAQLLGALPQLPAGVTTELVRAAGAVDGRPLVTQRAEVRAFFQQSAAALAAVSVR